MRQQQRAYVNEVRLHLAPLHPFFDLVNWRGRVHGRKRELGIQAQRLRQGRLRKQKTVVKAREGVLEGGDVETNCTAAHVESLKMRRLCDYCDSDCSLWEFKGI